ncbi:telomere-protecting terminal protein Tpg [Streptomyces sp. NPDC051243]|uniref:telomere-protecting terminal protein Tpg n=1 Tax=Streptomyces sp. NPDC051243 TaxID=3365646 RepID=UPI0037941F86
MGEIVKGLERALLSRPVPTGDAAVRFLLRAEKGSTKNMAVLLGISQRTVQRRVTTRPGRRRRPRAVHARLTDEAVRARWQPLARARRQARADADGLVFHTRARFGFTAPAGPSDDPRGRLITQHLSGEVARELFAARDAGGGEQQQMVTLAPLGHRTHMPRRQLPRLLPLQQTTHHQRPRQYSPTASPYVLIHLTITPISPTPPHQNSRT